MKRKLMQHGSSSLTVTLPNKWLKKYGLKKGDEVDVEEKTKSLIITNKRGVSKQKIGIIIKNQDEFARRYINIPYILGYDEIEVKFEDPSVLSLIENEIKYLLGYEIVEQGKNHCIIKNIASAEEEEFDNILRRLFLSIISMANESLEALKNKQYSILKNIADIEQVNTRLSHFCQRILNKNSYKAEEKVCFLSILIAELEQIADSQSAICNYYYTSHSSLSNELFNLHKRANGLFSLFYKLYLKFDIALLQDFRKDRIKLNSDLIKFLEKTKEQSEKITAHYLLNMVDKIHHGALFLSIN